MIFKLIDRDGTPFEKLLFLNDVLFHFYLFLSFYFFYKTIRFVIALILPLLFIKSQLNIFFFSLFYKANYLFLCVISNCCFLLLTFSFLSAIVFITLLSLRRSGGAL